METEEYRENREAVRAAAWGLSTVVVVFVLIVIVGGLGSLAYYRYFGVAWADARTDVQRHSKSYVEGTVRDLRKLQVQYVQADEEGKMVLSTLILQRAGELDYSRLPEDVRTFVRSLEPR